MTQKTFSTGRMYTRQVVTPRGSVVSLRTDALVQRRGSKHQVGWTDLQKFEDRVDRNADGHWYWTGNRDKDGYGRLYLGKDEDGKTKIVRAHRWAFEHWKRPLEPGEVPDHDCHVRWCVNPDHLTGRSHAANVSQGWADRRARQTHCPQMHVLADTANENGDCRTCRVESSRRWASKPENKAKRAKWARDRRAERK